VGSARTVNQQGSAQAERQAWGEAGEQSRVALFETSLGSPAVQAEQSPALAIYAERDAKFIAEAERQHCLAVPQRHSSVASGRRVQPADRASRSGQLPQLVDVIGSQLGSDERRARLRGHVPAEGAGVQQRCGIDARQKRAVKGHRRTNSIEQALAEAGGVTACRTPAGHQCAPADSSHRLSMAAQDFPGHPWI
jgi:hypothetical protein